MKNNVKVSFLMVALLGVCTYSPFMKSSSGSELALVPAGGQIEEVKTPTMQDADNLARKIIGQMGNISAAVAAKVREFKDSFISPIMAQFNAAYAKLQQAGKVAMEKANAAVEQIKSVNQQLVAKLRSLKEQFDAYKEPVVAVGTSVVEIYTSAIKASEAKADLDQTLNIIQRTPTLSPEVKKINLDKIVTSVATINAFVKVFDETVLENLSTLLGDGEKMAAVREALQGYQDTFAAIEYLVNDKKINMAALAAREKRIEAAEKRIKQMAASRQSEEEAGEEEEVVAQEPGSESGSEVGEEEELQIETPEQREELFVQTSAPVMSTARERAVASSAKPVREPVDYEAMKQKIVRLKQSLKEGGTYGK